MPCNKKYWTELYAKTSMFCGFFGLFLLGATPLHAQTKCFTVIDTISNEPIPYCNISTTNGTGLITNNLGEFCLTFSKTDTLINLSVSNISYFKKEFQLVKACTDSTIALNPKQYKLNEIDIKWSDYQFEWLGNPLRKPDSYISLWRFCQLGVFVPQLKNTDALLEKVLVPIQNQSAEKIPFRLHLYTVDSAGGVGQDLLPENVYGILHDASTAIIELDILKYQLKIPAKGLFVTIELLSNNKPNELQYGSGMSPEKNNNKIGMTKGRYRHRKMIKVSSWKPNSFYIEPYPFTNVPGLVGDVPLIKVKVREIKKLQ